MKRAASIIFRISSRSRESFSSGLSRFGVRSKLLSNKKTRLEINLMFQMTRFSRPMLKSGRLLTIAMLALASFGAPTLSAQAVCCSMPIYGPHQQQSAQSRGAAGHYFNINGGIYRVDDSMFVWGQNPYSPVGHIVAAGNGRYIATMYSGARYWATPVQ
jgi:hypothetical protein